MADLQQIYNDQALEIVEELFGLEILEASPDDEHYLYYIAEGGEIDFDDDGAEWPRELLTQEQEKELDEHLAGLGLEWGYA